MKNFYLALFAMLLPIAGMAQYAVSGKVTEVHTGKPVPEATITLRYGQQVQNRTSGVDGNYRFENLAEGNYTLTVSVSGYAPFKKTFVLNKDILMDIGVDISDQMLEEVVITATRASTKSPFTFKNLKKTDIEKNNLGQDLPFLLNQTPSVVVNSDAGTGIGYTDIRIRGSDATRINVTVNGIPLNNPESQGSFFVNLPDFASSVDNIQIQRGVGTSTNGASAFGASINIETATRRDTAYAELHNSAGSYGTLKNTVQLGTGLLNDKFSIDGRLSRIVSDGYIDRASANLRSFFLSGSWYGKNSTLRANVFSGQERTYLAWGGIPDYILGDNSIPNNRTYNDLGQMPDGGFYRNQTDNYQQNHYQLLYDHQISERLTFNGALHYTKGKGYYEEFRANDDLLNYGLQPSGTVTHSDLVRRLQLDNDFYGLTYSLKYRPNERANFILGGAYNEYKGDHFGNIIFASEAIGINPDHEYYRNSATKNDFNVFARGQWEFDQFLLYADMQYRHIDYSFLGFDRNLDNVQQQVRLNFFNPKAGVTYQISSRSNVYASFAVGNHEPNRDDFTNSSPQSRPKAENLKDFEMGYRLRGTHFHLGANGFLMLYKNQLILTGALNDVGEAIRTNIDRSYRAGIELDGSVVFTHWLKWNANVTWSSNKVSNYRQFLQNADDGTYVEQVYGTTDLALSPSFIGGSEIVFSPFKNGSISFISKYVSRQYLDNTSNSNTGGWTVFPDAAGNKYAFNRYIDAYFVNDVRLNYNLQFKGIKNIGLTLQVNNIFSEQYASKGATYANIQGGYVRNNNAFFVQAPINFLAGVSVKF